MDRPYTGLFFLKCCILPFTSAYSFLLTRKSVRQSAFRYFLIRLDFGIVPTPFRHLLLLASPRCMHFLSTAPVIFGIPNLGSFLLFGQKVHRPLMHAYEMAIESSPPLPPLGCSYIHNNGPWALRFSFALFSSHLISPKRDLPASHLIKTGHNGTSNKSFTNIHRTRVYEFSM